MEEESGGVEREETNRVELQLSRVHGREDPAASSSMSRGEQEQIT